MRNLNSVIKSIPELQGSIHPLPGKAYAGDLWQLVLELRNPSEFPVKDSLQSKNAACQDFVCQLNESLAVWGCRLPVDARVVYSRMADEVCYLLLSTVGEGATRDEQFNCFDTAFSVPIPEDLRSGHLQDAVYLFTSFLSEYFPDYKCDTYSYDQLVEVKEEWCRYVVHNYSLS